MSRFLLALILLAAAVTAHAITPAREGANGSGGTCPEEAEAVVVASETGAPPETAPAATKTAPPSQAKGGTSARPKSGARWHSFLPGMFK